jgi:galactonate dehydratase
MKISDVRPLVMGTAWRNLTFVVVRTDEGLEGVGEVRMVNNTDALLGYLHEAVPNHVLGSDPFALESIVERMRRNDFGRPGQVEMSGISAIEIACWDIVGKALNQPVYRLLGGPVHDSIKAYANGWYRVERTPQDFHAAARRVVEKGYRALKVDPFGSGWYDLTPEERSLSLSLVEAVRDAVGPEVELFVEMHGRFAPAVAIELARELEPFRPGWIEEPVPPENLKALRKVADHVTLPIATGERIHARHEYRELFELQAADIVQPDVTMCGGITETRKIASWADAYYVLLAPHNVGGPVATAAALHLAAATTNFKIQEHFNDFGEPYVKEAATGTPAVVDGYFALPNGPGLGVTLHEDVVRAHPQRTLHFDLFSPDWHLRQAERSSPAEVLPHGRT